MSVIADDGESCTTNLEYVAQKKPMALSGHRAFAFLLRFLFGLLFLHGLSRFLLGFLFDIGAFTHIIIPRVAG